ncbi:Methylenetetrahydrofolate dehydrogenase (NADP) / Methenyltetrahydrofolate cyclohydrolase [Mycoplasmopsis meleagridis]|uniref:Bifunctional protein FolD n=1 Tax=Mycoplasmopsis meleagridis ATCC 25294 TaxID=1264554 RepID=A0A0F5H0C6_9BACT|nr:bifunctional 5,10-methylenetetrahydrofolate dehydrogenase/5,10-methenyltetrahydrofolate cyclohydrolase [Mycoplasmopsis meleagridis]KKB26734.1 Methylenetetrahydrofolate dehydrogenase (NADP) / Methenyltetrahydrofolate cyclohydrolase [Mycoplasmopsis meleagridis ATCC 25294]OAD18150.1 Methylenetetrahydrofolate dehydrogenase (NADP) / Methenyltetrahydrofolate cyclohydrolase [Mycoplasmopsis meleagridis]VEU77268.1 methylenetetrahydrofolate dehydrogenase (NADP+), methenyltetrahydrofolate cyclohydrolase
MEIYYSKEIVNKLTKELKDEFAYLTEQLKRKPILAIIQVGDNNSSNKYIFYKQKKATKLGVETIVYKFPSDVNQNKLLKEIDKINDNADGVIVQLPLPENLHSKVILDSVRQEKDIDGLSSKNEFSFYNEKDMVQYFHFVPATALAVNEIIDYYNIDLDYKKIGVVGRSALVGKPIAHLLKKRAAKTSTFSTYNKRSTIRGIESNDIVVSGAGAPGLLHKNNLKKDAIVIDVGTTYIEDENGNLKLVGDVNTEGLENHISGLSPVPGGVGPLTVVCLFKNLALAVRHYLENN